MKLPNRGDIEFDVVPLMTEPRVSIDKVTLLVYSPDFGLYAYHNAESGYDPNFDRSMKGIELFLDRFRKNFGEDGFDLIEKEYPGTTDIYMYHFKLKGGLDFQFVSLYGKQHKITDDAYIETMGTEEDKERGYVAEYFNSEYNIRLEFNPNKFSMSDVKDFLGVLGSMYKNRSYPISFCKLVRVSRLDIAVDYPEPVNPCLIDCKHARKYFLVGESGKGIQTTNYGAKGSRVHFCIYDKKSEYEQKQKSFYAGDYLWRFEMRVADSFHVDYPESYYKQWDRLTVFHHGLSSNDAVLDLILQQSSLTGIKAVLDKFTKDEKHKYRQMFYHHMERTDVLEHPAELYRKQFPMIWEDFYNELKECFGRAGEPKGFSQLEKDCLEVPF